MRTYACDRCRQIINIGDSFYLLEAEPAVIINSDLVQRDRNKKVLYKHLCKNCFTSIFGEETK